MRGRAVLIGLVLVLASAGWPAPVSAAPGLAVEQVVSGLDRPVSIANAADGSGRLFVVEQTGRIRVVDGTGLRPTAFLNLSSLVSCCGERGLLGLAFHPAYEANGLFFVHYTRGDGDVVIARYRVSGDPNVADAGSGTILFTVEHSSATNHNGGQLQFGPDGRLYVSIGDGGGASDPSNPNPNAQSLSSRLGKLLRLDVDGGSPYAVPPDNPFAATPGAAGEIWALGLRNPWRFSFDRATGELMLGDAGATRREEVDLQPAGRGGLNYEWPCREGTLAFSGAVACTTGTLTPPILDYSSEGATGDCTIVGGYRYRGGRSAALQGTYLYADYCSGRIFGATESGGAWSSSTLLDTTLRISTFGEDEGGELYVADHTGGALYRLFDDAPVFGPPDPSKPGGYWLAASDGGVFGFGHVAFHGSTGGIRLNSPIVGIAAVSSGSGFGGESGGVPPTDGYWMVAADGGVFGFGDAPFLGSTGGLRLNSPIVGMAAAPRGGGYWLAAADGGIFAFGDAAFLGSTGGLRLNSPIVGIAATPSGDGYRLAAADGGIFAFGDAAFLGSTGGLRLNSPIVGMGAAPRGGGYWMVAADGGIFAFGDAEFLGSTGGTRLNSRIVGMSAWPPGGGYHLVAADGGIFAFGAAPFHGSTGSFRLNRPIVGIAARG